jgi:hypothetical protein
VGADSTPPLSQWLCFQRLTRWTWTSSSLTSRCASRGVGLRWVVQEMLAFSSTRDGAHVFVRCGATPHPHFQRSAAMATLNGALRARPRVEQVLPLWGMLGPYPGRLIQGSCQTWGGFIASHGWHDTCKGTVGAHGQTCCEVVVNIQLCVLPRAIPQKCSWHCRRFSSVHRAAQAFGARWKLVHAGLLLHRMVCMQAVFHQGELPWIWKDFFVRARG